MFLQVCASLSGARKKPASAREAGSCPAEFRR